MKVLHMPNGLKSVVRLCVHNMFVCVVILQNGIYGKTLKCYREGHAHLQTAVLSCSAGCNKIKYAGSLIKAHTAGDVLEQWEKHGSVMVLLGLQGVTGDF